MTAAGDSVLLLTFARRGEDQAIREALALLQRERPAARVFGVANPVSAPTLHSLGIADLIVLERTRPARRVLAEVARRRPVAAAIVYSGPGWQGHLKLEMVALRSGASRTYRCLPEGRSQVLGRLRLFASVVWKSGLTFAYTLAAAKMSLIAFCWLRVAQLLAGGRHAHRA